MSILEDIKRKYNACVKRRDKADAFYNNPNISQERKEQWMSEYLKLIQQLSVLIVLYERVTGKQMTEEQVWEGFKEVS